MTLAGQKIAVTGALGRAGRHIAAALEADAAQVIRIDVTPSDNPFYTPSRIVDLTRYGDVVANLQGCDRVVHFGSNPWPDMDFFSGAERYANNTVGTFNVFQAAAQLGIGRVVWASSETVQGFPYKDVSPRRIPIPEADAPLPQCAYALSKLTCERLARDMSALYGTTIVGLRLAHVVYEDQGDYDLFPDCWAEPESRRNILWKYVDIRDVVSATKAGLLANVTGAHVVNIAAGDIVLPVPVRDIFAQEFPETVVADGIGTFQTPVDLSLAKSLLGWEPAISWRDILDLPQGREVGGKD